MKKSLFQVLTVAFITFAYSGYSQVNKGEYFFDTDPGVGNGFNLPIASSADSVVINQTISVSGLTNGFHTLYVRTRMSKRWSETESRSFFITSIANTASRKINKLEYFFDTDPGIGSGFGVSGFTASDSANITTVIPVSSLSTGFHTLYIRTQDETKVWSQTESRSFFITASTSSSAGPITGLEYFFDTDPGVGLGSKIAISPSADSSEKTAVIPVSSLSAGFHTLYIRAKNNRGYGMTESRSFFITSSTSLTAGPINGLEYFFDTDPGVGLGTKIAISPAADSSEKTSVIPITGLTAGFHTLYVRARNSQGYGQTEARSFFVISASGSNSGPVSRMEYFIDTDPGVGLGTALTAFTAGDSVEVTRVITIPVSTTLGDHKLYVRSRTTDGRWAITEVQDFTIACGPPEITSTQTQICPGNSTVLSMVGGNKPGTYQWIRNGVAIPGANAFEFTATLTGTYRLKYANGTCTDTSAALVIGPGAGVTATINPAGPVVLCSTLTVDFNANTGTGFTYQWLLNNSPINGQTNAQLTGIGAAGSYSVIVTNATGCRDTSAAVAVSIGAGTGDPAVFPVNSWNVYAYTGTDINFGTGNVYRGFYSINALNVNTSDQWGGNLSPSSASGYLGCAVPNDNFSWVLKRKGFPSGPYVMNIPSNDDNINVLVNGTSVYSASCCGASPTLTLGNLDANSTIEVRMVEFGGGANVAFNLTLSPLQPGSISGDQTICGGGTPSLLTSTVNASGGATNTITYQWQDSTAGGAWQNIANATNSSFQPGTLNANRWFRRKALNGPDVATSNEIQITIVFPEGNPAQFGNNGWNLYAYQGTDLNLGSGNSYLGFYTVNSLSINTADQWNGSASPSSFSGYSGCPVPLDNFTFVLKRQGFTPGAYLLNILAHDDNIRVYVNDVQIFEHLGCCDQHLGIDLGTLGANSTVEVRTAEFGGGAVANLEFVASSFQGGAIAADQTICAGIAPSLLTNVQEASGGSGSPVYQWQDSLVGGTWQNIDLATATSFQPGILTVTKWFRRRAQDGNLFVFSNEVKITVLEAPSASVSPVGPVNLCSGDFVTLTGTFSSGSSRQWLRNGAAISGQTGTTLTATLAGIYKAVATAGTCTDTSNAVVINVNPKPAPVISPTGTVTICQGQQATFNLTNFVAGQTVRWKDENATILGTGNSVSVSVTSGVYVVVSNASGCRDSSAMAFVQVVNPTLAPTGPIDLCAGNSTNLTLSGSGTASIKWFRNNQEIPGQTGPILSVNSGGTYLAEVSVIPGCSLTSNAVVVNSIAAPAATISSNSTSFCQGGTITLTANSGTGFTYVWRRNGQPISGATEVIFEANQAGDYTVVVTNSTNCSATSNVLTLNQIPNQTWFFDNDGDGYGAGQSSVNCIRPVNGFLPAELIATSGDCNDNNPSINPGRQFFSLSTNPGFTTALCSPLTGTPYTNFQFQVVYTDLNNGSLPATFPRVILDYEGNGSFTNGNDRTILMSEFDNRDNTTIDGKIYVASINSLIPGTNYTTRVLSTIGGCATQIGPFNYPDVLVVPDLQIFANDISFSQSNPPVSSPLTVSATIHNVSDFSANNFVVHLVNQYDTNIVYPDIVVPTLAAHSSTTVTWDITTPDVPAWCPMQVFVDYTNAIEESNELDNSAIRPFVNGNFNLPGSISPNLSVSPATVITGGSVTVSGTATYTNTAVPLADPSVAGAQVTITINQTGATFTTFTNSSGGFSFSFPVNYAPGTYTVTVVITDFTLSSTTLLTFTVVVPQCLPDLTLSTFVSSTNIVQGESITGSYFIKNVGCEDVTDSTLLGKSQSGGTPIMANEKIGPLAVNQSVTIPFGPLAFNTPGTFSICGTADAGFQVQESSESNNSQCQVITVIPFLPDIFPTFCGGGTRYISDDVINLGFGLQNSGGSATGQFLAKVLIFKDGIKVDSFDHVVPNVARQSGYSFSIPYSFNQVGTYSIQIQCDAPVPGGVVAETDETNNVATCSMVVLPTFADLTIGGCGQVKVLPANPVFPGTVQYQATIRNNGNATATGPIPVQFRVGNSAPVIVNITGNLAPGQSVVVNSGNQASVAPATAGLSVTVNPLQTINESDFGNNKDSSQLCHDFQPIDIPPLCGSNFWNSTYLTNQAIFLWVGVNQYYYYDASQVKVRFFVSGPGLNGTINLGDALLNNVSRNCGCPYLATLPTNFAFPQEGVYTFTMTVDPDGDFTECDETNNTIVRQVRVSGLPDMRILSQMINPSLLNPQPDVPINISVSYENIGASNIDQQMMLKVLVDEVPLDSAIVSGLVTGDNGTVDFTTPWSSSTVGAHVIRTIIDSRNQVEENDEINNEATRAVIVGDAANLYFQVFAPNNGSPAFGQNITINARIGNNGDEATNATVVFYFINNQGDTIQIGQRSISVNGNDSLNISIPWTVINPTTTLIGKIINSEISEFNYDDNVATAPIGLFGVTLTPTPACAGQPNGQLAVSTTGGTEPFTYQWSNGFTGQILTAGPGLYTVTVTDFLGVLVQAQGVIPNQPGQVYYADSDGDGYGNPANSQTACVLPPGFVANNLDCNDTDPTVYKKVSRPSILRIGGPDFCAGSSVQLSVPELNGVLYQWSSGQQTASISVTAEGTYFVTLGGDSVCPVNSDTVQLNILNSIVPQVSISGSNGTVCEGSTVSLQASIVNAGQNPSVSWLVNGVILGSGNVFSPQNLTNGDLVKVVLSASESCANPASVSDSLTFNVMSQPFANAGFGQSICGNSTQLTANTVSGAIGTWTVEAGTGVFVDQNDPLTVVSGLSNGINRFRWTLTNGVCPPDFDQVIITVSPQGVVANAGQDQSICQSAFATLSGNSPGNGTGSWTVIQGTGQVNNPIQPNSLVSNLSFGQNVLVWTVTSGTCEPLTDTVVISRFETPVLASAGLDQSICGSRTQLSAEAPVIGQGQWSVAGGTAIFDNPSNPQSGVSGLSIGDNVLVWTITNGNCTSQTDEVVINVTPGGPSQAIAGPDQTICGDTTLLAAGIPQTGIGVWKVVSGNAQIIDSTNAQSKVDLPATGQSVLVWTVSEGSCAPSTDTVIISRIDAEIADAGPDQSTCSTSANLQAHQPLFGSGSWSVTLGTATVDNPNDPFSAVSGLESGENKFVWTIVNGDCPPSSDTVIITRGSGNLTANAGIDQEICADTAQLSGNIPDPNSGTWSVAFGSGIFDDETQPGTTIRGLEVGITKLVWTITDPDCGSVTDTVFITRIAPPSQANAGSDQNVCSDEITLSANAPQVGIGSWEWVEDEGTISDIHNPFSQVTGLVSGTNTFVWTISNGNCPSSKDTVVITREAAPSPANAGADQSLCSDQANLAGNVPQTGTGAWRVISGSAVISDSTSATSPVTNLSVGVNEFVWSITNGSCPASTDTVVITREAAPSPANAGADQSLCSVQTNLAGNVPQTGTGAWTVISGSAEISDSTSATSAVTNLSVGVNEFVWSITNGSCPASTDTVVITREAAPTPANAGTDQNLCSDQTTLSGNVPQTGTGAWTVISGSAVISDSTSVTSSVTNLSVGVNEFVWSITNGSCPASTDTVVITREAEPSTANAGVDQGLCSDQANLAGNAPQTGTGAWTVISGSAVISDSTSATSPVTNLSVGVNEFVWSITNGSCPASTDTVVITREAAPSPANAGADQSLCSVQTNLAGNVPQTGTGAWTVISGSAEISDSTSATSAVTNLSVGVNEFVWSITNGSCPASTDTVVITREAAPSPANAGADQSLCSDQTNLAGNVPQTGTGAWTVISGSAVISDSTSVTSSVTNLSVGVNEFVWSITNGSCPASTDTVAITREAAPSTANAGSDQSLCSDQTTLSGNIPQTGTGAWTVISGSAVISDSTSATSTVTNLSVGVNEFVWSITNGSCPASTDTVVIIRSEPFLQVNAGIDSAICGSTYNLQALAPTTGIWSVASGTAQIVDPNLANTQATNLQQGLNSFVWSVQSGSCPIQTDTVVITSNQSFAANAGPSLVVCSDTAQLQAPVLASPATGKWSVEQGSGTFQDDTNPTTKVTNVGTGLNVYRWTVSVPTCPDLSDTIAVIRIENNLSIHSDTAICFIEGDSLVLTVPVQFTSFTWSNGATTRRIVLYSPDTLVATVQTADGCNFSDTIRVREGICGAVAGTLNQGFAVRLQPNPASSQVWMDIRSTEEGNVQMSILNALGQEFGKDQTLWLNTENQIRLETDQWPSGMYTIRLSDGKRNWTGKLVIRR